jgi:hypothetical protein
MVGRMKLSTVLDETIRVLPTSDNLFQALERSHASLGGGRLHGGIFWCIFQAIGTEKIITWVDSHTREETLRALQKARKIVLKDEERILASFRPFSEIAKAGVLAEERDIVERLVVLAPRLYALPYKRNLDTPGHRLRGLCHRLWSEGLISVREYIREKYPPIV